MDRFQQILGFRFTLQKKNTKQFCRDATVPQPTTILKVAPPCSSVFFSLTFRQRCAGEAESRRAKSRWHAGEYRGTYLASRGLISMYKCVCQELDYSRCSFPCKSHTGGLSQSVYHKQEGTKFPRLHWEYLLTKLPGFI